MVRSKFFLFNLITSELATSLSIYRWFYCAADISQPRPKSRSTLPQSALLLSLSIVLRPKENKGTARKCLLISVPTHFYVCCALFPRSGDGCWGLRIRSLDFGFSDSHQHAETDLILESHMAVAGLERLLLLSFLAKLSESENMDGGHHKNENRSKFVVRRHTGSELCQIGFYLN